MPFLESLLSVLSPHNCLVCGVEGKLLCAWCTLEAFPNLPSRCYRCKQLTADFAVCTKCRRQAPLNHVWICTQYETTAKELLRRYKYERAQAAASILAHAMHERLPFIAPDTLVVSVPTATNRIRERGYDHAHLLARVVARKQNLIPLRAMAHLGQARQVGANRSQRLDQLKDAFLVTKPELIKDAHVLLIDDVVTTGATLEAAARELKRAGAKTIDALAFAQKQ